MNRPPSFQFYPKDWLDFRVQRMSLAAQGMYMKILCFMWSDSHDQCSIAHDETALARAIGISVESFRELFQEIQRETDPIFLVKDDKLVSVRLKHEAMKLRKYRQLQIEKGKRGAEKRWHHGDSHSYSSGHATAIAQAQPEDGSSSSSSSSIKNKTKSTHSRDQLNGHRHNFDIFWTAYPKKRSKGTAEKIWAKLAPDDVLLGTMLAKLDQAKQTPQWTKDRGEFIPNPGSWLNAKGWEDEYVASQKERLPL